MVNQILIGQLHVDVNFGEALVTKRCSALCCVQGQDAIKPQSNRAMQDFNRAQPRFIPLGTHKIKPDRLCIQLQPLRISCCQCLGLFAEENDHRPIHVVLV